MPTLRLRFCAYAVLVVIALVLSTHVPIVAQTPQATAEATSTPDPLIKILSLVPDQPAIRTDLLPISYADYRAAEAALNIQKPANGAAFASLSKDDQANWVRAISRLQAGPNSYLLYFEDEIQKMPALVGFDLFDVDQAIQYGTPPHQGIVLGGKFDYENIGKALSARDFQQTSIQGIPVWTRFEDGQTNLQAVNTGDPFGGELGRAARIALLPGGFIANTVFTNDITQVVGAFKQTQKTALDSPDVRALADAITDAKTYHGVLVQAFFIAPSLSDKLDFKSGSQLPNPPDLSTYNPLPAYSFAVIADRQEGQTQVSILALAYSDQASAQAASTELHTRIAGLDVGNIYENTSAKVDSGAVYQDANGQFVALVAVRYPLPSDQPDPSTGTKIQPGLVFARWTQMLDLLQFFPLAIQVPGK